MRKNAELTAIGKFFYKMTFPYMDTIVAGEGETSEGGSDPGLGSTDLRQSLRARETCCTEAQTQVRYIHIPVSIIQRPEDMLHRGTDPGQVTTNLCQSPRARETNCTGAMTQVR
jgi:hypothetical protein